MQLKQVLVGHSAAAMVMERPKARPRLPAPEVRAWQLARLALKKKNGPETLRYLNHLPANQREIPQVLLLSLEAFYLSGDAARGDKLAARLSEMAKTDVNLSFAAATALLNVRQNDKAEAL